MNSRVVVTVTATLCVAALVGCSSAPIDEVDSGGFDAGGDLDGARTDGYVTPSMDATSPLDARESAEDARSFPPDSPDAPIGCGPSRTMCGATCVDTQTDPAHCGGCDAPCSAPAGAAATCVAAGCSFRCDVDRGDCDGDETNGCETDLTSDPASCGACGTACPAGGGVPGACIDRACGLACPTGWADCNVFRGDGCEISTAGDEMNCGGCGIVCAGGELCRAGVCRPRFVWSRRLGGAAGHDAAQLVAADADGNAFVSGYFTPPIDLGGGPIIPPASGTNFYFASYDSTGAHRWSRHIGGGRATGTGTLYAIASDGLNRVFLGGQMFVGPRWMVVGGYDAATGATLWAREVDGFGTPVARALAVAPTGDLLVTGDFTAPYDFGAGLADPAAGGAFVASYDGASGAYRWARTFTGSPTAITTDDAGNVYVAGTATYDADFGAGPIPGTGGTRGWIASYDPTGAYRWARIDSAGITVTGLACDGTDWLYLSGTLNASANFGGGTLTPYPGSRDFYIASFGTATGAHRWSRMYGGTGHEDVFGAALDRSTGILTLVGSFTAGGDFGDGLVTSCCLVSGTWSSDGFLASYQASTGAFVWANKYGREESDSGRSVAARDGALYFSGAFSRSISFGGSAGGFSYLGGLDGFIAVANPGP